MPYSLTAPYGVGCKADFPFSKAFPSILTPLQHLHMYRREERGGESAGRLREWPLGA